MNTAVQAHGGLDILVANAGVIPEADLASATLDTWERTMATNGRGMFLCCKYAAEIMVARGKGAIVCLSSISAFAGQPGQAVYGPSKFVASGLTKHLAIDLAAKGVRVNAVAPGTIATPAVARMDKAGIEGGAAPPARPHRPPGGSRERYSLPRLRRSVVHHRRGAAGGWRVSGAVAAAHALSRDCRRTPLPPPPPNTGNRATGAPARSARSPAAAGRAAAPPAHPGPRRQTSPPRKAADRPAARRSRSGCGMPTGLRRSGLANFSSAGSMPRRRRRDRRLGAREQAQGRQPFREPLRIEIHPQHRLQRREPPLVEPQRALQRIAD